MKIARTFVVGALLVLLSSCAPIQSLRPWYTESDLVLEPVLVGDWYAVDDNGVVDTSSSLSIVQDTPKGYTLYVADKKYPDLKGTFVLYLFRLKDQLFVDESSGPLYYKNEELKEVFKLAVHLAGKVSINSDDVRIDFLDDEWVEDALKARPSLVRHEVVDEATILTGSQADLQNLLLIAVPSEKSFSFTVRLKRTSAVGPQGSSEP